ncbi:MAG TPA: hypothetical protein VGR86_03180 [Steroidobacteraceae bacterium]|nr:hypothetical protein [Steroidobacteraceae bacterium]
MSVVARMRAAPPAIGLLLFSSAWQLAVADQAPLAPTEQPPLAAAPATEDRLLFSANGDWLTGGGGGGGASALWSRTFAPQDVLGVGAEYQQIANAHWTNGVLSGSLGLGSGTHPTAVYAEVHEGAGDIGTQSFTYSVVTAGLLNTPAQWLTVQLEERRIDVDTSHGNLPKLGLALRVAQPLLVSVSYADTVGGNLGTQLTTLRIDYAGRSLNAFAGAAGGRAAPAVLNLLGQIIAPRPKLKDLFAGVGRSFSRADWQLLADYEDLEGFKRTTITLLCTLHLDGRSRPP